MLWLDHICASTVKFPKSWFCNLLCQQKIHHFFFSQTWGTHLNYLPERCPYMFMYSALHIMQWFSHILDVFTPKNFDFNIFYESKQMSLTQDLKWSLEQCSTLAISIVYQRHQTDLLLCTNKLLHPVSSSSKHGRQRSSLLLYSRSMFHTGSVTFKWTKPTGHFHIKSYTLCI